MSNWWLLPAVAITSIWLGAAVGIVVAALMASAGRRNSITCNGWFSENKLARVNDRITPCDLR